MRVDWNDIGWLNDLFAFHIDGKGRIHCRRVDIDLLRVLRRCGFRDKGDGLSCCSWWEQCVVCVGGCVKY